MQELLNKWGIKIDYNLILNMWNESHRHYHNQTHLVDLIDKINSIKFESTKDYEKLILAALFHDIIYDPMKNDNEEKSAKFFLDHCVEKNGDILDIEEIILETKTHIPSTKLSRVFSDLDMSIVESDFPKLLEWEEGIWEEYKGVGKEKYKVGRLNFLNSLLDKYPNNWENLSKLIEWVEKN